MSAFLDETGTLITVSSSNPFPVGGKSLTSTCIFTRPADTTAYAASDVIADSASAPTAPFAV